jgi:hypothetical protein
VNIFFNITLIKKTEALIVTSIEVGPEVNAQYMLMSHQHSAGQNDIIKICNISFENVAKFRCLGTSNKSDFHLQATIQFRTCLLLSRNLKVRIYETIILCAVLYGYETCSLILKREHRMRVFENGAEENI